MSTALKTQFDSLMAAGQREQPLLESFAVIWPLPLRDRYRIPLLFAGILSTERAAGRLSMQVVGGNAQAGRWAAWLMRQRAWSEHGRRAKPECGPKSRTLWHLGGNPFSQEGLNWLVLNLLGHQVELAITQS